ncbi:hypothetical protein [Prevotella pallens]|uniref:hypothetical protein n=1 Tax=Prevotella pallens TaxID=60133 RepID=UPI00352F1636
MQRDFYERVVQIPGEGNVISTNGWCNSKRMQCDFYERVGQILRECNVISTNGVRMEWEL